MQLVPRRSRLTGVLAVLLAIVVVSVLITFGRNERLQWEIVAEYFFSPRILTGLWTTIWLTAATVATGFILGIPLALMRQSRNAVFVTVSWGYIWFFRSVPVLVQLLFWFNLGAIFPTLDIGIPFGEDLSNLIVALGGEPIEWSLITIDARSLITALMAAVIGLIMHEAALAAEIIRGGLLAVDAGQTEAAYSLGMSRARVFNRIVFPQAMRTIVPATGNMVITTLKGTSIVSVIAVQDLLYSAQTIYAVTFQILPLLLVATIWYLICTSALGVVQYYIERHYERGANRALPPTPLQRVRAALTRLARQEAN